MNKGIILAGGLGTRLYPLTVVTTKQLLPLYDKPLIYYPLSTLMLLGIRNFLIIIKQSDKTQFELLLGDGSRFGINIVYEFQDSPNGIADALNIGKNFVGKDDFSLILGDNFFHGSNFIQSLKTMLTSPLDNALVLAIRVENPEKFGVVEFDNNGLVISIDEKPLKPKSNYIVPGLYIYPNEVLRLMENALPSARGELEITDINNQLIHSGKLKVVQLGRGITWFDTGDFDDLHNASTFVSMMQKRQNILVGSPEEIAYSNGWISREQLLTYIGLQNVSEYKKRLRRILSED